MVNIAESLAKTSKTLILKEPFYGLFLVGLNKTFRTDIPTAGVSKNGIGVQLSVNPEFFSNLPDLHKIGLLKHELLHISFGHLVMRDIYSDHKLFNIAADLEINQYIEETHLPEGGVTLDSFPELKLPKKAGTRKYYELLEQDWKEFDELTEADKKLVQKQVEHQLKETADQTEKRCGSIPGELADLIHRLTHIEPPSFDWKGYLKRFVGNSSICYTKKLRRKFNKRYTEMAGLKVKFKNNILVGVDTSGSVSNSELKEFMNELVHMHKTGHKITVAQCDTQINSVEAFNPRKDWEIKGRGGTDFQPVIDLYNQKKGKYTALIYLTDGEAYTPEDCPKNALWVHSTNCNINEELPGLKIQLN